MEPRSTSTHAFLLKVVFNGFYIRLNTTSEESTERNQHPSMRFTVVVVNDEAKHSPSRRHIHVESMCIVSHVIRGDLFEGRYPVLALTIIIIIVIVVDFPPLSSPQCFVVSNLVHGRVNL